jgi:hypothetical protein
MSFVKLDGNYQLHANDLYEKENDMVNIMDALENLYGKHRWFSIGRTHIEQGFMALRKGITEAYKNKTNEGK